MIEKMSAVSGAAEAAAAAAEAAAAAAAAAKATAKKGEVSKDAFLQLLVAQVKNQDPLNPTDGVQFLSQLAQFTQLEQTLGMRTDLQDILAAVKAADTTVTETKTGDKNV